MLAWLKNVVSPDGDNRGLILLTLPRMDRLLASGIRFRPDNSRR